MKRYAFRNPLLALMLTIVFASQGTWALAGTTGGITGTVTDESGAPVAGASVKIVSASQQASGSTDAAGKFHFLSLAPDTYTVSIEKDGYNPLAYAGVTVFADNQLTLSFRMTKALKTIAKVSATSAGNLVKSGVGADIYSVNSQAITTSSALGGGGNLNSAYSAISSVPGAVVPAGGAGWNQATYVRGSQSFFTGFEYDGIPVNRAFDNYNSSTESSLGLQELQVYTGGGPSSSASAGTSGFINQVFKTGTYPGYLDLSGGIGTPTYYHQAKVEAGGSTPDRRFSYYVGLSGYNQGFRPLNNDNGGIWTNDPTLGVYTGQSNIARGTFAFGIPSIASECSPGTTLDPNPLAGGGTPPAAGPWSYFQGDLGSGSPGAFSVAPNCYIPYPGIVVPNGINLTQIADRENVANFHFRIPQKNGTSDDIQLLGSSSMLNSQYYSSFNDIGGYGPATLAMFGTQYCNPATSTQLNGAACTPVANGNFPAYTDAVVYNAPFGTPITGLTTQNYFQPDSNPNRQANAQIPADNRDGIFNDTGIVKLQYTHQFSTNAFVRIFGYTFFSDWTQSGAQNALQTYALGCVGPCPGAGAIAANYDLITHTGGGQLEIVDQLNSQHLLQLTGNYTQANVVRFNNTGYIAGASPIGLVSQSGGVFSCWDPTTGQTAVSSTGIASGCAPGSSYQSNSVAGITGNPPPGSPAANAGAQWVTLWNGNASGTYNTVKPKFTFVSLSDQWRPNDRWLFNGQLRYENYEYDLVANPGIATDFYAQIVQNDVCTNASGSVLSKALLPGQPPPAPVIYTPTCAAGTALPPSDNYPLGIPAGYAHPSFTATSPGQYTISDLSPRLSMTYTQSPDTVWRASIGRFTQPPISASVQYLNISGNALNVWNATLPLGFFSPFHPIPAMSASQADLSFEHHFRGTDMSMKVTPFYNWTYGYQEQNFLGPNFVTQAPVGNFRSEGAEFAFTKGDFAKDGLSTQLAITYTFARVQYVPWFGVNQLNAVNQAISQYNLLTKGGGGSPFYCSGGADAAGNPSPGVTTPNCGAFGGTPISNPYFNSPTQGQLNTSGWYPAGNLGLSPTSNPSTTYFDVPWNLSWLLNWRKQKFAATFTMSLAEGAAYGGPLDIIGVDPRTCGSNSSSATRTVFDPATGAGTVVPVTPITALSPGTDPFKCDALTALGTLSNAAGQLYIPNPQTGSFAQPGQFRNPWIMVGNLALTYDISPRISANVTLANIFHTCFGGTSAPWTTAYGPSPNVCSYVPAGPSTTGQYVSNFYNGTSPNDVAANGIAPPPWQQQSYLPGQTFGNAAGFIPNPFTAFFQLTVKI
jgi:Carboxypeptidase regulatory-like domain/TonB dependent receptor-like, beta-barrel